MIDDKLLRMLKNPNPEQRKKAITELAKTKNREALTHLANVYRSDSDPEIRELARKAGVYISKNAPQSSAAKPKNDSAAYAYDTDEDDGEAAYDYGATYADEDEGDSYGSYGSSSLYGDEDEDEDEEGGYVAYSYGDDGEVDSDDDIDDVEEEVIVSALDQERAQGLVQQALDVHMRGNNDRAIKYLAQAYAKNPRLKRDSYTSGLAATLTGLPSDQAVDYIIETHGGGGKAKRGQKGKRGAATGDPTWGDALVDLAIYWFVNVGLYAVGAILIYVLLANLTQTLLTSTSASASFNTPGMPSTQQIVDLFNATAIPLMLLYCVAAATASLVGLIIHYYAIHFVSVGMLGGDGTMPRLIRKLTLFYTFIVPILTFVVGFASGFLQATSPEMAGIAALVQIALSLGLSFWISAKIGDVYEFGAGRGCVALVLSYVGIAVCSCMLIWGLTAMLGSAASQAAILF